MQLIGFSIYILTVLWYTVFKRSLGIHNAQFELFWSYKKWFSGDADLGKEIMANIAMFIPFGFLLSVVLRVSKQDKARIGVVIIAAILFSLTIETLQLVQMRGLFEWDDVVSNTLGAVAGAALYCFLCRWKYAPESVSQAFVLTCLAVVITGHNVGSVEADITPRVFCFQVDSIYSTGKEVTLSGFAFRYDHPDGEPTIILRSTETGKRIKLEMEQISRPDVNSYFLCDHDYTDCGFKAVGKIDAGEYEILIRWPWSVALSTGVYIDSGSVCYASADSFNVPETVETSDLREIVENGTLRVYRPDYHCWVYQVGGYLYWIVDEDFHFDEDGTTYIQYQMWTTQIQNLPEKRLANGNLWDNVGGYFEEYELPGNYGPYRVMKRELPTDYSLMAIETGYFYDGEWVWRNFFRPIYELGGDS